MSFLLENPTQAKRHRGAVRGSDDWFCGPRLWSYTRDTQHNRLPEHPRSRAGGLALALSQKRAESAAGCAIVSSRPLFVRGRPGALANVKGER
jgi:hypothetical protein